ncbi:MAG: hypothetical protein L0215_25485 [Gemmataceae bacterium]|nr:hypothetical protein [Gemmataceae bacterium]
MGLFLAASGVIGADSKAVERSVGSFVNAYGGTFEPRSGTTDDPNIAVITQGGPNTTVLYPREFMGWDELSQHLSKDLQVPVFSFHIHDGDLWMFVLFDKGEKVTQFNPIPEYWEELDPKEKASWSGDVLAICRHIPGLSPDSIKNYFVEWTEEVAGSGRKAYPDDEFAYGSDWQLTDFMRRVGLKYPVRDDGAPDGQTFRLRVRRGRGG